MKHVLPCVTLSATLFASWLALSGTLATSHIVLAALLAFGIPLVTLPFIRHVPGLRSLSAAMRLTLVVLWDIVLANVTVARLTLGKAAWQPVFTVVPLHTQDPYVAGLLASIVTMTPGTVSCDADIEGRRLLVHALDCADPAALVDSIKERYEKPLMEIFGC